MNLDGRVMRVALMPQTTHQAHQDLTGTGLQHSLLRHHQTWLDQTTPRIVAREQKVSLGGIRQDGPTTHLFGLSQSAQSPSIQIQKMIGRLTLPCQFPKNILSHFFALKIFFNS